MSEQHPERVRALFDQAADLPPAQQRTLLDACCAGDPDLRARVEYLLACDARLRAEEGAGGLLDVPLVPPLPHTTTFPGPVPAPQEQAGPLGSEAAALPRRLGRYQVLEEIGRGGMGAVLRGHDPDLGRDLAVKVLLPDHQRDPAMRSRFTEEAQIGGQLQHPGIVPVHDVGRLEDGRPFIAMKLIQGRTLANLLAERASPAEDLPHLLAVFEKVCQTVAYAHSRGVIHRDLKPSNVMVGTFGEVQVMDWGLAKVLRSPHSPVLTSQQEGVQPESSSAPVSLTCREMLEEAGLPARTQQGLVLGTPAYMAPEQAAGEVDRLDQRCDVFGLGAILCEILTGQPPYRGAGGFEILDKAARADLAEAFARLGACGVDGELIGLALRSLAAVAAERPRDAGMLAAELAAYRESLGARLRKAELAQVEARARAAEERKRRRLTLGVAAFVLLAALLATWQAVRATRAEAAARSAEQEALQAQQAETQRAEGERLAKLDAQTQKTKAEQAAAAAKAANAQAQKQLRQIEKANDLLGSIFENLDPKEIARADRPLQAILVDKLDRAVAQLEGESIGDPLVVATMQVKFGLSLIALGEPGKAIVLLEKALPTQQARLGPDHPDTLISRNNLAVAYQAAGKLDLALPLLEGTLKLRKARLGPEHPHTLHSMNNLAGAYLEAGKLDLALPLYEASLNLLKARLGPEHPDTLRSMNNLAWAYQKSRKLDLALALYEATLKLRKATLGPEHPDTLQSMNNLASAYKAAGQLDLALPLLEEALKLEKARLGPEHSQTLSTMGNLAQAYQAARKLDLALPLLEETLKLRKARLGPDHPQTLGIMNNLAVAYQAAGKVDLALPLLEEALKLCKAKLGPEHPQTLTIEKNLDVLRNIATIQERYRANLAKLGPDHIDTLLARRDLAQLYLTNNRLDEAERILVEVIDRMKTRAKDPIRVFTIDLLRKALTTRERTMPDSWLTFRSKSLLGGALLGLKDYAAAEPLLLAGYEGMKKQEAKIPPPGKARLTEAVERLVQLYEATDKKDEAAKWRKELEALRTAAKKPETKP